MVRMDDLALLVLQPYKMDILEDLRMDLDP